MSSGQTRNGSGLERRGSSHRGTRPGTKRPGCPQDCGEGLTAHLPPPARTLRFPRLLQGRERALKHRLYRVHAHRCTCTRTCTLASNPRHAVSCFSLEGPPQGAGCSEAQGGMPGGSYFVLKEVIGFLRSVWISWESGFFHSVSYWASETLDSTRPPEQLHLSGRGPLALSQGEGRAEWHSGPGSGLGRAAEGRGCPRSRPRSGLSNWPDLGVPTPTFPRVSGSCVRSHLPQGPWGSGTLVPVVPPGPMAPWGGTLGRPPQHPCLPCPGLALLGPSGQGGSGAGSCPRPEPAIWRRLWLSPGGPGQGVGAARAWGECGPSSHPAVLVLQVKMLRAPTP